ncbi:hypothetical protein GXM_03740 [Nostoc sphaeroides CCNUC1]|uniref:Uncharacterized protein n=1 Tax=Nostoc sphaeroides CCNUC1 TaxID=2653204 RepID=A0A5P8W0S0_9NOSO|nr:hypothetical protein GXM_03740 [Nostoc sphaeroides CCNUC1]
MGTCTERSRSIGERILITPNSKLQTPNSPLLTPHSPLPTRYMKASK